jgi:glycosyltransferase involved in cell wall biosynthesis
MKFKRLALFSFVFSIFCLLNLRAETINIICDINGAGTERDFKILEEELILLGHKVNHVGVDEEILPPKADINIFIETPIESFFKFANKNYFIPNPEYCFCSDEVITSFDLILCRTHEVERIFKAITPKIFYLGFTSLDRFQEDTTKTYSTYLHAIGKSPHKGTKTVFKFWKKHPSLPMLVTISRKGSRAKDPLLSNVYFIDGFIDEEELVSMQNYYGIHICTSETEGFGHYISEGMSAGAVIVTTDAPPMNEFIEDKRCLVQYNEVKLLRRGLCYQIDEKSLASVIARLKRLPRKELIKIGERNRLFYLEQKQAFKTNLKTLFGQKKGHLGQGHQ